jgi:hypothetical protein
LGNTSIGKRLGLGGGRRLSRKETKNILRLNTLSKRSVEIENILTGTLKKTMTHDDPENDPSAGPPLQKKKLWVPRTFREEIYSDDSDSMFEKDDEYGSAFDRDTLVSPTPKSEATKTVSEADSGQFGNVAAKSFRDTGSEMKKSIATDNLAGDISVEDSDSGTYEDPDEEKDEMHEMADVVGLKDKDYFKRQKTIDELEKKVALEEHEIDEES